MRGTLNSGLDWQLSGLAHGTSRRTRLIAEIEETVMTKKIKSWRSRDLKLGGWERERNNCQSARKRR